MLLMKIQAIVYIISLTVYVIFLLFNCRQIWYLLKKIPIWLYCFNIFLLIYKLFFIPRVYSITGDFGIWTLYIIKSFSFEEIFLSGRSSFISPIYFFIIKLFSSLFNGVTLDFVVNFNIFLSFINIFSIFLFVWFLFKDKIIANIASLFFAISPIMIIMSLTDYFTNPAIFFSIQSLLFLSIFNKKSKINFLIIATTASILAIGLRPEYIVFMPIFILLLYYLSAGKNIKYLLRYIVCYIIILLPNIILTFLFFYKGWIFGNTGTHKIDTSGHGLFPDFFYIHVKIFINNLLDNFKAIFNLATLMGIFFALASLVLCFKNKFTKYKKIILFFIFYYCLFFLYYAILHNDGLYVNYKYITSLVAPITILAAIGMRLLFNICRKLSILLLLVMIMFSLYAVSSKANNKFNFKHYHNGYYNNAIIDIDAGLEEYLA